MEFKKKLKIDNFHSQRGFVALLISILILVAMITISVSISNLIIGQYRISSNVLKSTQAYFAAESGIEDALLRLVKDMKWTPPLTLKVGQATSTTEISAEIGGARIITSEGNFWERIRKVRVVYEISAEKASFYYGAQVGEGGIIMLDGSTIKGNVFSNGSIEAAAITEITGTVKVAKTGNYIDGVAIGEDAYVDVCKNSQISGTLTCSNSTNCTAFSQETLIEEIATSSLPISQTQIDQWKAEALAGGIYSGDYTLQGFQQDFLGPKKIEGELKIQDLAKLSITGTIWVTGTITIQNLAKVRLDEATYGSLSGVIIGDSKIKLQDVAKALGSGQQGSYLLLISTSLSDEAIKIQNISQADILFSPNGWTVIQDVARLREVSGYGIRLQNIAEIEYEVGLEDVSFTSGPGGSWQVTGWREIK